jgi:6-phosphogluconolactonase
MPRNFNFDPSGNFLLVAHQKSDNIVIFKIDKKTGLLTDTGKRINIPNPVCIKWID